MSTYRVLVRGEGLVVRRWFVLRRTLGFFATRFVAAPSPEVAEEIALRELRGEPRLTLAALRAPRLIVEEVSRAEDESTTWPQPGIVFYPEAWGRASQPPAT